MKVALSVERGNEVEQHAHEQQRDWKMNKNKMHVLNQVIHLIQLPIRICTRSIIKEMSESLLNVC
jgi:hypothetical protein